MFELNGKYTTAKVFTDNIEQEAISQIINMCSQKAFADSTVRIMPDVHAGKGCTIGTTMTITDKVCPNLVGVDIGCGMEVIELGKRDIDMNALDEVIAKQVPSGFSIRGKAHPFVNMVNLAGLRCIDHINYERALLSLGSLGGGNHFIELNEDAAQNKYLVIHSGSRHLGTETVTYYQNEAYWRLEENREARYEIIERLKAEGRQSEIQDALASFKGTSVPKDFAYCEGELFDDYIHDMKIVQKFAMLNRKAMADEIMIGLGIDSRELNGFTTIHNYIDMENMILRKGAVSAQKGERLIIPMNMRDGSLICIGKGNPDWNCSAPHGAGRLMSRSKAKEAVSMEEFQESMKGIFSTSVCEGTLDESPMAYKPMDEIIQNIQDTVDIVDVIKPLYNFKAHELTAEKKKTRKPQDMER